MALSLSSNGLTIQTLEEILEERRQAFKQRFGNDYVTDDSDFLWKCSVINAERELKVQQALQQVFVSRTLQGAEDTYLDDILGRNGFYRRGETSATGYAVIETDDAQDSDLTITQSTVFRDGSGNTFSVSDIGSETKALEFGYRVVGLFITKQDIENTLPTPSSVSYTVYDSTTDEDTPFTYSISGTSNSVSVTQFFNDIKSNIESLYNVTVDIDNPDTTDVTLRYGYETDGTLKKNVTPIRFYYTNNPVGLKASSFLVEATEKGDLTVPSGSITSVSPTSANYLNVTNTDDFTAGSDSQTDAEFLASYFASPDTAIAGTRPAVESAVNSVTGVDFVRIYDNPLPIDLPEADALTFNTVVSGGAVADIAEAIALTKPLNANTSGTQSYTYQYSSGSSEVIRYSPSVDTGIYIIVDSTTSNSIPLTSGEKSDIQEEIQSVVNSVGIGDVVFNAQIASAVFNSLRSRRLTALSILIRQVPSDEFTYTNGDFDLEYNQTPFLAEVLFQ
jgi:uncharacterized phage protein gp47/JayE